MHANKQGLKWPLGRIAFWWMREQLLLWECWKTVNLTSVLLYVLLTQCSLSCKPLWYESVNTVNSFPCVVSVEQVTSEECNFGTLHRTNRGFRTAPVQLGSLSANEMLSKVVENVSDGWAQLHESYYEKSRTKLNFTLFNGCEIERCWNGSFRHYQTSVTE